MKEAERYTPCGPSSSTPRLGLISVRKKPKKTLHIRGGNTLLQKMIIDKENNQDLLFSRWDGIHLITQDVPEGRLQPLRNTGRWRQFGILMKARASR